MGTATAKGRGERRSGGATPLAGRSGGGSGAATDGGDSSGSGAVSGSGSAELLVRERAGGHHTLKHGQLTRNVAAA